MSTSKQSVNVPSELVQEIQSEYVERFKSARGAMQEMLARGAMLSLMELRGQIVAEDVTPEERTLIRAFLLAWRENGEAKGRIAPAIKSFLKQAEEQMAETPAQRKRA